MENKEPQLKGPPEIAYVERITRLMDSKFRIPFTRITFGIDPIISLVPVVGDVLSFSISGLIVLAMSRHGVSAGVLVRMVGNILMDLLVGAIPVLGSVFDFLYKANRRNFHLLREHYQRGKYNENKRQVSILFLLIFLTLLGAVIFGAYLIIKWLIALST